jgi:hypothetical protein
MKREAIGILIGKTLIKKNREVPVSNSIYTFLAKMWNDFISLFSGQNEYDLQREIDTITGKIATDVLEGGLAVKRDTIVMDGEYYQVSSVPAEEAAQLLKDSIDSIYKKIKLYEQKSIESFIEREKEVVDKLMKNLADENYKRGLLDYVINASKEMQKVVDRYQKTVHNPQTQEERRNTIKSLSQMNNYVNGFKGILDQISTSGIFTGTTAKEKNLSRYIDSVAGLAGKLQKQYYKIGKPILADILKDFSTNPNADIAGALDVLQKDVSWGERMLDELASSGEPILMVIDKMVKEAKNTGRLKTVEVSKTLLRLQIDLEKSGIPTTHFMFERNYAGELTGNILTEFNEGEVDKRRKQFFKDNPKPEEPKTKDKDAVKNYKAALKLWKAKLGQWFTENYQEHPDRKEIMAAKRAELIAKYGTTSTTTKEGKVIAIAEVKYNEWFAENVIQSTYFDYQTGEPVTDVRYKKELAVPADNYRNKIYAAMYSKDANPQQLAMRAYHEGATKILKELDGQLPEYYKLDGLAPQVRKDFFERATLTDADGTRSFKSVKQIGKELKNSVADTFIRHENDVQYGLTDESGQPVNFLPTRFTKKIPDPTNMSLDMTSSIIAFAYSANDFAEMNKIIDVLEYAKDVVGERDVFTGKYDPVTQQYKNANNKGRPIMIKGKESLAYKRLEDFMKMTVYGQSSKDEGDIWGIDKGKLVDFVNSYTSLASLALNLYSGISNITVGYAMTKMEAVAGEFVTNKDMRFGDKTYTTELPGVIADIGQRLSDSKLDLWIEHMGTMQNYDRDFRNVDAGRSTVFSRLMKTSSLFFMSHAGEHMIQTRLSLALANNTKVKDKDGNIINLWEAFDVEGNRLKMKEGLTKVAGEKTTSLFKKAEEGQPLTEKDILRFMNRQNFMNKRLHGIYNDIDKSALQQYALGRLVLLFRKFIIPGWNRRYSKMTYNEEGEAFTEGYYRTLFRFLGLVDRELGEAKFSITKNWNNLTDADKANFHRLLTEWAFLIASVVVGSVLTKFAEDDEENYVLNLAAYEAYRTYSEIRFFTSITEAWRIVKSPAASVYKIDTLIKFIEVWNWGEEVERGKYKGMSKFEVGLINNIPLGGTIINIMTPEEQLKFYTNNGIKIF